MEAIGEMYSCIVYESIIDPSLWNVCWHNQAFPFWTGFAALWPVFGALAAIVLPLTIAPRWGIWLLQQVTRRL